MWLLIWGFVSISLALGVQITYKTTTTTKNSTVALIAAPYKGNTGNTDGA